MKLADALSGVTVPAFDTAPFIYFIERHPVYLDLMREIVRRIDAGAIVGRSSVVTLTEVLTRPKQVGDLITEQAYRRRLLGSRNFMLVPIDTDTAADAANLRARYRLRTPDALQIAAALRAGGEAFLTNDTALGRVTELRVLLLDDLEL